MTGSIKSQRLSNPDNDNRVISAWESVMNGHTPAPNALRRLINDSWRRCLDARIDPVHLQPPSMLEDDQLLILQQRHSELVTASQPVMMMARDFLAETGSVMILTDPEGVILSIEGDPRGLDAAASIQLTTGYNWNELRTGTNAIGTALMTGQAVQVHAAEHFCSGVREWTCTASIIRDPYDGQTLGAIDISGLKSTFSPHSLALVATTASRIESMLAKRELRFRYQLLEQSIARFTSSNDGIIICDRRGRPIKLNEQVNSALLAQNIKLDLNKSESLFALDLNQISNGHPTHKPEWLQADWIEPVINEGERIGTVLTIPSLARSKKPGVPYRQPSPHYSDKRPEVRGFNQIIGQSPLLKKAIEKAHLLAKTNVPVLIHGETGVGKENFVRGMHQVSDLETADNRPFVALNCGGLTPELLASELFGYCEGAFTGARKGGMIGKVEAANGGTLFLDEIGEMPLDLQPHFLRVLEEGEIYRIGENKPRKINFKLITATNRDLREEVSEGHFRMDLYYRISVTSIHIPVLREIKEDIPLLVDYFLGTLQHKYGHGQKKITPEALRILDQYAWPGNIRELRNTIENMYLMSQTNDLLPADIPEQIISSIRKTPAPPSYAAPSPDTGLLQHSELISIEKALALHHGNMTSAAKYLGIAKSTLYMKIKKYGIETKIAQIRNDVM
ncbi:MAG: sigma-54-dependent Fis family transcriptional regulator [Advenella sp.]